MDDTRPISDLLKEIGVKSDQVYMKFQELGVINLSQLKYLDILDVQSIDGLNSVQKRMLSAEVLKRQTPNSKEISSIIHRPTHTAGSPKMSLLFNEEGGTDTIETSLDHIHYKPPVDAAIEAVDEEITDRKHELVSAEEHLEKLEKMYPTVTPSGKKQCSNCHIRGDHTRNKCQVTYFIYIIWTNLTN